MLLTVRCRKRGRKGVLPMGRHPSSDDSFVLMAGGSRRQDLRGRADVRVTLDGWERAAHAGTKEDPDSPDGGLGSVVRPCRGASALREGQRGAATDGPGVQTIACHGGVAYPTLSH